MPDELKPLPCPFCGGSPKCDETHYRGVIALREYQCQDVGCPMSRLPLMGESDWNTRAVPAELAELREVVAKLPKTADGVSVVPGMMLWHRGYRETEDDGSVYESGPIPKVRSVSADAVWNGSEGGGGGPHFLRELYSSKEVAKNIDMEDFTVNAAQEARDA